MTMRNDHEVLAGLYGQLLAVARAVTTDQDFHRLVATAAGFQRYSPINRLYLAVQGAQGAVANQRMWESMPATDGYRCRIRPGERALRVLAPIHATRRTIDPDTGRARIDPIGNPHYRMVPVFHEAQLVVPPAWPIDPPLEFSRDDLEVAWTAIASELAADGYTVRRVPNLDTHSTPARSNWIGRTVAVRDDLGPADALRALIREYAAMRLRASADPAHAITDEVIGVEADAVALLVARRLKIDPAPDRRVGVAPWSGREGPVSDSAERVLVVADQITSHLEIALACDLTADAFQKLRRHDPTPVAVLRPTPPIPPPAQEPTVTPNGVAFVAELGVAAATVDEVISRHLAVGGVRWGELARQLASADTARFISLGDNPAGRALALSEAGASAATTADVLVADGTPMPIVAEALTATTVDANGDRSPLFSEPELAPVLNTLGADPRLTPAPTSVAGQAAAGKPQRTRSLAADPIGDDLIAMWSTIKPAIDTDNPSDDLIAHWSMFQPIDLRAPAVAVPEPAP